MINFKNISTNIKSNILEQVTDHICTKYNCKPSEVKASFDGTGNLKVSIVPENIDNIFDCEITTNVIFKG